MKLVFTKKGLFDTVQDGGRTGYRKYGVPISGFMDQRSARLANQLVGNADGSALFEFTLKGPTLEFQGAAYIALTGADMEAKLNGDPLSSYAAICVEEGDRLVLGTAKRGCRSYLAIQGAVQAPTFLGSQSTLVYAKMGTSIQSGDVFEVLGTTTQKPKIMKGKKPFFPTGATLRILPGPECDDLTPAQWKLLETQGYTVGAQSNRMGYRLKATEKIKLKKNFELLSSPILKGTVQLPQSGFPMVFMADAPTSGGYPRVGQIIQADLDQLAQLQPGNVVRFALTDMKTALDILS